jgi:hypothetical protein
MMPGSCDHVAVESAGAIAGSDPDALTVAGAATNTPRQSRPRRSQVPGNGLAHLFVCISNQLLRGMCAQDVAARLSLSVTGRHDAFLARVRRVLREGRFGWLRILP